MLIVCCLLTDRLQVKEDVSTSVNQQCRHPRFPHATPNLAKSIETLILVKYILMDLGSQYVVASVPKATQQRKLPGWYLRLMRRAIPQMSPTSLPSNISTDTYPYAGREILSLTLRSWWVLFWNTIQICMAGLGDVHCGWATGKSSHLRPRCYIPVDLFGHWHWLLECIPLVQAP